MNLPAAPRRPARVAAVALLLILHVVLVASIVGLRTTRSGGSERIATLLLLAPPRQSPAPGLFQLRPRQPLRPLVAPLPPITVEPLALHDSATPVAGAPTAERAGDTAASAPPGPARLDLTIPKAFFAHPDKEKLTPAQEAMQDPRSNRLVLTRQEKMDIAFGSVECIAWQRQPDGSIYRGPGHLRRIQGISTNPFTMHDPRGEDRPTECVK